jgi:hypothetical protein
LSERIRRGIHAESVTLGTRVQSLWGGYGEIRRVELSGVSVRHAIVKHVTPPSERELGRDAARLRSHRRKLRSYTVELAFYLGFAAVTDAHCRVPGLLLGQAGDGDFLFVLEDLDAAGFPERRSRCTPSEVEAGLAWLASFHARFVGVAPEGLWKVGTYWHLATRPDELARMVDDALRRAAPRIDQRLSQARFKTLLHGDAKLENFCFARDGSRVAAVDFQYVGGGVGVKDVAYFLGSCIAEQACARDVPRYLEVYFALLRAELGRRAPSIDAVALEAEWRELFSWAWVDFHRFLLGWAPGHARDSYGAALTRDVLAGRVL